MEPAFGFSMEILSLIAIVSSLLKRERGPRENEKKATRRREGRGNS